MSRPLVVPGRSDPRRSVTRLVFLACATATVLLIAGCGTSSPQTALSSAGTVSPSIIPATASPWTPLPSAAITVSIVGDSNSTGFSGNLQAGLNNGAAWAAHLPRGSFSIAGGWAVDGSSTTDMADAATTVPPADVVVILGGTNDLALGQPTETTTEQIIRIAQTVSARQTVLAAIPPFDPRPGDAVALNASLADLAADRGWLYVDPWSRMRQGDGTWTAAYRTDGIHTTPAGYALAGESIAAALSAALK